MIMMKRKWLFVISLLGMAVSAAVLILLIPSLFREGEQTNVWAIVVLACLAMTFAVGTLYWRTSTSISDDR
jgi:membrane protein DedA with SNARE-associated domain